VVSVTVSATGSGGGAGAEVAGSGADVVGRGAVADGVVVGTRPPDPAAEPDADGAADVSPVAEEKVAADVIPANTLEARGCPSWPSTTGDFDPVPAITGTASTRAVTTVLRAAPRASRPLRRPAVWRPGRAGRGSALVTRTVSGRSAGSWCTA
jgi:hypothetical protein